MASKKRTVADLMKALFTCREEKKTSWSACKITGVSALTMLAIGTVCLTCVMWFSEVYVESILNAMTIRKGSQVFDAWSKPPVKPLLCFHVFNYTNLDRFNDELDPKIILHEVGPYCYRETLEKKNITWNDDGTITYGDTRTHVFEPEHSKGSEEDIILVPNLGLIAALGMLKDSTLLKSSFSMLMKGLNYSHSLLKIRAKDFFFGYDDRLIDIGTKAARILGHDVPFDKFGLLSRRSAITQETITVATGTDDLERIGVVTEVDGKKSLSAWGDPECDRIDGSDGAFFPRHGVNESATIYLFHRDLCRRMPFIFQKEVEFQDGIMAMRFHAAPDVYNTEGTCYCPNDECSPQGVFDLSPCTMGVPMMMSFPHFLYGDPKLREPFEGLNPDPKKHEFYIDVNGMLGFTLGTVSRLQLNLQVHQSYFPSLLEDFPEGTILPIVWIQVSAERMPPDLFNMIYHATFTVPLIQDCLRWGSLGLTLFLIALLYYIAVRPTKPVEVPEKYVAEAQEMLPEPDKTITIAWPKLS